MHVHLVPPALTGAPGGPAVRVRNGAQVAEIGGRSARIGRQDITSLDGTRAILGGNAVRVLGLDG